MRLSILSLVAAASVFHVAAATAVPNSHTVHERRHEGNNRWVKRDQVASHVKLPVRIGLKQNQDALAKAQEWLMDVSHPSSEKFGQHWSQDEVIEAFAPPESAATAVQRWIISVLGDKAITHSDNKAWLAFDASVSELESLVHAKYHEYYHEMSGRTMISCGRPRSNAVKVLYHVNSI